MIQSNVKVLMERQRITYAMLAKATGISSQTITRARGARIRELSLDKLHVIACALGVTIKDLFDEIVPSDMPAGTNQRPR